MAYHVDGHSVVAPGTPTRSPLTRLKAAGGLLLAGLGALVVALLAALGGWGRYVVGVALAVLGAAGLLAWLDRRTVARTVAASAIFALVVLTIASLGGGSFTLLLLPLFIVGAGLLLPAVDALVCGGLSVLAYDAVVYVQTRRALPFADVISMETFALRALAGTLALAATALLVYAGRNRWETAARSSARRGERLLAALEIGLKATSLRNLDEMLNRVAVLICQHFGWEHAQVFLVNGEGIHADLRASTADVGQRLLESGYRVSVGSAGVIGQVTAGAGPIVARDADLDEVRQANELLPEMRSELALPLRLGAQAVIGALDVQSSLPDAFVGADVEVLQKVADQVAIAVENVRVLASEAELMGGVSPIVAACRELSAAADIGEVLTVLRRHVVTDFDRLSVVRLDADRAGDVRPVTLGVWDRDDLASYGVNFEDLGLSLETDRPRIVADSAALDEKADATLKELLERLRARSFAAFPLRGAGEGAGLTGFLLLYRRAVHRFSGQEVPFLRALADQVAVVVENLRGVETVSRQRDRLAILNELSQAILGILDLEEVGGEVARRIGRLLDYEHLSLARLDEGRGKASLHLLSADDEERAGSRVFPLEQTAIGAVVETGQTMVTPDLSVSEYKDHQAWRAEDVCSAVVIPLATRGRVLGTLNLGFPESGVPGPEDVGALEQLAAQLAVALDNAALLEAERRRHEEAARLLEVAGPVSSTLELGELVKRISVRTAQVCAVDRCTVFLLDRDRDALEPLMSQFADGQADPELWEPVRSGGGVQVDSVPLFRQVVREREPVVLDDVGREDLLPSQWTEPYGISGLLCVPLVSGDQVVGLMALDYAHPDGRFGQEQVNLATTIGSQVAASIENAWLYEQVRDSLAEVQALYNASLAINLAQDVAGLLETSVREIGYLSEADRARVYLVGPDPYKEARYLDEVIVWWRDDEASGVYQPGKQLKPADVPPLGDYPGSRSNVVLNNLPENQRLSQPTRRALKLKGVESLAMVPLAAGAAWLGAVVLEKYDAPGFGDEVIRLCRGLADQTALALNAQHLLEATRRSAAREVALREISARLRQAPDAESVLQVAVQELGKALGVAGGSARLGEAADDGEEGQPGVEG